MSDATGKLRFGICGLGFMGRTHFSHLRGHRYASVAAICDRDEDRRSGRWGDSVGNINKTVSGEVDLTGVRCCARFEELIGGGAGPGGSGRSPSPQPLPQREGGEGDDVDVVAVTLPSPAHADRTVQALEAGKNVICEKPMALSVADCDRMIAAAAANGRTLMIAQCIRFWPQYEVIKRCVDEGMIGEVRFASLKRIGSPPGYSKKNWLMDARQSGGALLDLHVHDVDFAQHLLGVPQTVAATGSRGPSGGIDHVLATWRYPDGRYAVIEGGWVFHPPWPFEMAITVQGTKGTLHWSMTGGERVRLFRGGDDPERLPHESGTGWTRELDYFIDCIRNGRPVDRCPPSESRANIALALAEAEAIERGGPVNFGS